MSVTLDHQRRLYRLEHTHGVSYLGFDVCIEHTRAIAKELRRVELLPTAYASREAYRQYRRALAAARQLHEACGRRLNCGLTPQLRGLEGARVRVVDRHGEERRFFVGRSQGPIPVHLELPRRRSAFGIAVFGAPFQRLEVLPSQTCGGGRRSGAGDSSTSISLS